MLLSEFDYHLPDELIAQEPLPDRAASRMLIVRRDSGTFEDRSFRDLPSFLAPGDCLALNDTRVFPARLLGIKEGTDRSVELFLLRPENPERTHWAGLVRPGRHLHEGTRIVITPNLAAEVLETRIRGERLVRLECSTDLDQELDAAGHIPLPPYIHRLDQAADRERYQTVFAQQRGSVAAPTAGLHFTPKILESCAGAGATVARITLHVGLGTFQPLIHDIVEENHLHTETYSISAEAAAALQSASRRVAVGTTSARTLESAAAIGPFTETSAETDIFIYPGYQFRAVDALLTNFHLPKSSLLLLVSAFAGKELIRAAYDFAVAQRYRFFSYGDCMLIL
ncbi:MAG: tRNA preQ1(34) S-adenosylmethionine ribosyltransferase-isomerase QueA [Acidobacteria bacterium]|nr:tRNA preQ1(34) S-adenosylmethionine ribosyltransferase-isomerase QueA [Acidobacteriota bacterium]